MATAPPAVTRQARPDDAAAVVRCPGCATLFEVSESIWTGPDTRVRCGECFDVFDAREAEHDPEAAAGEAPSPDVRTLSPASPIHADGLDDYDDELDYTLADFDLYSDADLLADDADETRAQAGRDNAVLSASAAGTVDTAGPDPLVIPAAADAAPVEIDHTARLARAAERRQRWRYLAGVTGAPLVGALCAVALVLLVVWRESPAVHNSPWLRPLANVACSVAGCQVPLRSDIDRLVLLKRNVYAHPNDSKVLVIDVTFENQASFAQAYPTLGVRLSDSSGTALVTREFPPPSYADDWQSRTSLAPGQSLDILLRLPDPGDAADTFELMFTPY